jgi:hypothetical protein
LTAPPEPLWQELHDAWWSEQREPRPGDLEADWDALWEVVPAGWKMPKVVSAQGPSEPTVLVELARSLVVYEGGRVPR